MIKEIKDSSPRKKRNIEYKRNNRSELKVDKGLAQN